MKKLSWQNWAVILSLIAALLTIASSFYGWLTPEKEIIPPGFVCPDGTLVSVPENCPICNGDGICQDKEKCDCEDCENNVNCIVDRIGDKEYLLILNEKKKVEGESVKVTEILNIGRVTIEVEGITREMETTRKEEIIDGLKVTTQEIIYNNAKPKNSVVIVKIEKYTPGENEYLLNTDEEKIISNTKIRLMKVFSSTPSSILLDVGETTNRKLNEGVEETLEGLKITLLKSYSRSISSESYAILKIES
ncbi:MAG: hypothetical protein KKA79_10290 [Nanoarchaeota archaeon]|nr:hypothetical protein [Nanoarchaeota archaeon]